MRIRQLKTLVLLGLVLALLAAVLAPVASAAGTQGPSTMMGGDTWGGGWCGGGMWDGSGTWGGTGMWGTGFGGKWLTSNPDALQAWLSLRTAHQQALQTWYDTYKGDLTSAAAQQALHDLWTTFWTDMKAFYETYAGGATWTCPDEGMWGGWGGGMMGGWDWDVSHMWGTGYGAAWMTQHPGAFGGWMTMRTRMVRHMNAWWQQYGSNPSGTAAQNALSTLRAHHRAQVKSFYTHHHLSVTTTRMRYGAGGWMGLGGMWGGWGW